MDREGNQGKRTIQCELVARNGRHTPSPGTLCVSALTTSPIEKLIHLCCFTTKTPSYIPCTKHVIFYSRCSEYISGYSASSVNITDVARLNTNVTQLGLSCCTRQPPLSKERYRYIERQTVRLRRRTLYIIIHVT
jgi:hypothetical protein